MNEERDARILKMNMEGQTIRAIALQVGLSRARTGSIAYRMFMQLPVKEKLRWANKQRANKQRSKL